MLKAESLADEFLLERAPIYRVVKSIPAEYAAQIENAVMDFIDSSDTPDGVDRKGFYFQTLEAIANATYLGGGGEFWLGEHHGKVVIYALAHVGKEFDNRLGYHISQTWVHPDYRGKACR
jgi:hypothetical protein